MSVKRVFVEKKPEYAIKARELREEIESYLDITEVTGVRVLVRYDIENISEFYSFLHNLTFLFLFVYYTFQNFLCCFLV